MTIVTSFNHIPMLTIYAGSVYSRSISAILINALRHTVIRCHPGLMAIPLFSAATLGWSMVASTVGSPDPRDGQDQRGPRAGELQGRRSASSIGVGVGVGKFRSNRWPSQTTSANNAVIVSALVVNVLLSAFGVCFVRGNPFDLMILGGARIIGDVLCRQANGALGIGMVLRPTLEISLRQGLSIADGSFAAVFTGYPVAGVLMVHATGTLSLPLIKQLRSRSEI